MKPVPLKNGVQVRLDDNNLLHEMNQIMTVVDQFKTKTRRFYFEVVLSKYSCPDCGGKLKMTGTSRCSCNCGQALDPTLMFQKSVCCGAVLIKKTFHYACSRCRQSVASRFIFDERVFDKHYFREMMRQSRKRKLRKREAMKMLLAASRSQDLHLEQAPDLSVIPGLLEDLDAFIDNDMLNLGDCTHHDGLRFDINQYRRHLRRIISWSKTRFSAIASLLEDERQDRVWRFVTLVFMQHEGEVQLVQDSNDLFIRRVFHEIDN
jgi:hypothetical protein